MTKQIFALMTSDTSILRVVIRRIVPRFARNAVRRPAVAGRRLLAQLRYVSGTREIVKLRPDWEVHCHPICVPEFQVFRDDPLQVQEMEAFISCCSEGMRFVDVGAHWGAFSLAVLRYGGASAKTICIEPSSAAVKILRNNLALNKAGDRASVVEGAAGMTSGEVGMLTTGAGGADYYVIPTSSRPDTVLVRTVTVSDICQSARFTPTHLKIDVEGYEEEVLIGAFTCIEESHPILFLELHGDLIHARGKDPQTILSILTQLGYRHFEWNGRTMVAPELAASGFNARLLCRT